MVFEIEVATHLMNKGFQVDFNDLDGYGQNDYIAIKNNVKVEIECKYISRDKGRQIHRKDLQNFASKLESEFNNMLNSIAVSTLLVVTLSERLSSSAMEHDNIIGQIRHALGISRVQQSADISKIDIKRHEDADLQYVGKRQLLDNIKERFDLKDNMILAAVRHDGIILAIALESKKQDKILDAIYRELKQSAQKQFSGQEPAILCCYLDGTTGEELESMRDKDGQHTKLNNIAKRLMQSRPQVLSISFSVVDEVVRHGNKISMQGKSYTVRNEKHEYFDDMRYFIFDEWD